MVLPDVNILLYAFAPSAPKHAMATAWLRDVRESREEIAVLDQVLVSFVRIATHPRLPGSASPQEAIAFVSALLDGPMVLRPAPTAGAIAWFSAIVEEMSLTGNDVGDAYLVGYALDLGATLVSSDRGFARFPGLLLLDPTR